MTIPISGEERERKQFVEDGYVLVSESFILFLPSLHGFLYLLGSFRLVNMDTNINCLLTQSSFMQPSPGCST